MDNHESYANYERLLLCLHLCIFLAIFADRQISSPADDLISLTEVKNHSSQRRVPHSPNVCM